MAEGVQKLICDIRDQKTEKRNRPDQCGGDRDEHRNHNQHAFNDIFVTDAQVHRMIPAEGEHIQILGEARKVNPRKDHSHRRQQQEIGVHIIEAREHFVLNDHELVGIQQFLHKRRNAVEKSAEDQADQKQMINVAALFLKKQPVQQQGEHHHQRDGPHKPEVLVHQGQGRSAEQKDDQGLQQHVQPIQTDDAGRQNTVVRNRLKHHRGKGDRRSGEKDGNQLLSPPRENVIPVPSRIDRHEHDRQQHGDAGKEPKFCSIAHRSVSSSANTGRCRCRSRRPSSRSGLHTDR
ncbi:hypothetical protein D1872_229600 [compost metagenome]